MNTPFLVAQIIRAATMGIRAAERENFSPAQYLEILDRLADDLTAPPYGNGEHFNRAGIAVEMPGTHGGFTMAVFEGHQVPVGTPVYVREQ
jgi:hypothetical protein